MITTTLNTILCYAPCGQDPADGTGWWLLLNAVGKTEADDEPLALLTILDSNGLDDCIWALRCLGPEHEHWVRLFARECASDVLHLWDAPQVVKDYLATGDESIRAAARDAAGAVARAAAWSAAGSAAWSAAGAAAGSAAWAAVGSAARSAAWSAARDAAGAAARAAAWSATGSAAWSAALAAAGSAAWSAAGSAAWSAARDAAWAAAGAAARDKQNARLRAYLEADV